MKAIRGAPVLLLVIAEVAAQPAAPPAAPPAVPAAAVQASRVRHSLRVTLDPARRWLSVADTLTLPPSAVREGGAELLLNGALRLTGSEPAAVELPVSAAEAREGGPAAASARFFGINGASPELWTAGKLKRYRVALPPAGGAVRLRYEGAFDFGLSDQGQEYARGFRETTGIVSPDGVYLAGNGFWYPHLSRELVESQLEVALPEGWHVVSAGDGTSRDAGGVARWDSGGAVDEITLVGGPLVAYRDGARAALPGAGMRGTAEALVYLRRKDDALADKYLRATRQYLEMYSALIGPYPYTKFALVENFWETGYGMPSFTLLGAQVIRLPFILTSSYPHEILHNWWGNSVFVDYDTGNWCEGLTAYMADHLLQEQAGRGADYRRDALQKYRSYVRESRDFPLSAFRSRHSAATEAVGYGKTLMVFHMLRRRLGDDAFRGWAGRFYREFQGRRASFADVRRSLEEAAGVDLERFFADHVARPGAARLAVALSDLRDGENGAYETAFVLEQTQPGEPLLLDVPVVLQTAGQPVATTVRLAGRMAASTLRSRDEPVALHVDPHFDVFRLLDPRETPPSIGQIFGEPKPLAVLPASAPQAEQQAYRALVEGWRSEAQQPELVSDAALVELPADRAVWLLGRTNALAARLFASGTDYALDARTLVVDRESMPLAGHSAVLVRRHPGRPDKAIGWIFADDLGALPGLGRKLPHYGKYSYLGFEGDEPTNVLKGQWPASDSPLRLDLRPTAERAPAIPPLALPARKALAELPAAFSEQALLAHVAWLAAPEREGRGIGTRGLDAAAEYLERAFRSAGLRPGGDDGTFYQAFTTTRSASGAPATLRNVIGVLPGARAEWQGQSALLCAHYDHLGSGFPDVRQGDAGKLHPGADDNASGVAVLLELARALAGGQAPQRTIVFAAFSGEEAGLLGSEHYAQRPRFPLEQTIGVVNLDTVGRLLGKKLSVLAAGSAAEWPHIFRGAGFVAGVETRIIPGSLESSDHTSFIGRGVPAVQLFTEAHLDYHRPSDTADKIDGPGLLKVAALVKEVVGYLGEREQPLTNTIASMSGGQAARGGAAASAAGGRDSGPAAGGGPRRVSFGTLPDFAFAGPGVRVAGVTPGSPAEQAGVLEGDVLRSLDGQPIVDLRGFSGLLRGLAPGQRVRVALERGGREHTLELTVVER